MNFKPELAEKVMTGEKTVTRRHVSDNPRSPWWRERCLYQRDKVFTVNPGRGKPNIGHARVTGLRQITLGHLSDEEAQREGFKNRAEFEAAFVAINSGTYDPKALVWRINFKAVPS